MNGKRTEGYNDFETKLDELINDHIERYGQEGISEALAYCVTTIVSIVDQVAAPEHRASFLTYMDSVVREATNKHRH